jgi:hypothetical protein
MNISSSRVLDQLPAEEPCIGAVFTSYGFDPAFFEDHILRAVLRLTSDPVEQPERYHHEARRALQETPVAVIVDAAERGPGRRLPFDLLEVSDTVFHPKSVLLLYRTFARLLTGSGNLTSSGYGGNTELFLQTDLSYSDTADASLLAAFDAHLGRIRTMVRQPGTQFDLVRAEMRRRIPNAPADPVSPRLAFLDSTSGPIVEQLKALLPQYAVIESIGMLAPFYERDDVGELDSTSIFGALLAHTDEKAVLDVGVAWDNPQMHASNHSELQEGLGRLWTWEAEQNGERALRHIIPQALRPNSLDYIDEAGASRRCPLDHATRAIGQRKLWMQPPPVAFAPRNAIAAAAGRFADVRMWLHPSTRLDDGRPLHRPLHAKLMVVGYRAGRNRESLVMLGSPNMSRRALLMKAGPAAGNVEVAVAFRLNAVVTLRELVPELVRIPSSAFELSERSFPELGRNYALAIDRAAHDPIEGSLTVTWSPEAADLPAWRLTYGETLLASASSPPAVPVVVSAFVLKPSTAEVVLHVDGRKFPVPILVTDLVALPALPAGPAVGLDELLMLLGRRIGAERAIQMAAQRVDGENASPELAAIFGDGFDPTDVFRAWWSVAEDLCDASLSVQGFRLRLEGALGAGAAWACMLDAAKCRTLTSEEVWFYGAELLRTLEAVALPPAEDRAAKRGALKTFCTRVRDNLDSLAIDAGARMWLKKIEAFYSEAQA